MLRGGEAGNLSWDRVLPSHQVAEVPSPLTKRNLEQRGGGPAGAISD